MGDLSLDANEKIIYTLQIPIKTILFKIVIFSMLVFNMYIQMINITL